MQVVSLAGERCVIKVDLAGEVKLVGPKTAHMRQHDGLIELDLKKAEAAVLYTGAKPNSFVVAPIPLRRDELNSWGVRTKK